MWIAHILHANETNGKMEQIRRKDYLEWRGVFVVVCGGLGWRRRWLDSVALLFLLLLPRVEVPSPASSSFLFRSVFLSRFFSLYLYPSPLFFLSIPMFFFSFFFCFFLSLCLLFFYFSVAPPFFFLPSVFRPFPPLVLSLPLYL